MNKIFKNRTAAGAPACCVRHGATKHLCLRLLPRGWSILGTCCILALCISGLPAQASVNVTQHHNHLSRDGLYIDPFFTNTIAATLTRDGAFDGAIIGNVYAQPLYVEGGPQGG